MGHRHTTPSEIQHFDAPEVNGVNRNGGPSFQKISHSSCLSWAAFHQPETRHTSLVHTATTNLNQPDPGSREINAAREGVSATSPVAKPRLDKALLK